MLDTRCDLLTITLLFFGSLILFTWGLNSQEVISFDSRFYLFAQEMWRDGASFFPTTYHKPYPDYPGTSTWLIYLLAKLFGHMNKFIAILPSALLGSMTVVLTYMIGALHNKRWGLYGVIFLFLTATYLRTARSISLDMYSTFITTYCFYLIYSADKENRPRRTLWIYLLFVLGFTLRGPIGLVMPAGVVCGYYLFEGQTRRFFTVGFLAFLLLLICSVLLLKFAFSVGGFMFLTRVLRMEVFGRIENHFLPWHFYFTDSLGSYAFAFSIAVFVLVGIFFYAYKKYDTIPEMRLLLKLTGWMSVILIGMSIPDDKKVRYILPMLPAVALIAAYPWVAPESLTYLRKLRDGVTRFFSLLPLLFLIGTIVIYFYARKKALHFDVSYAYIIVLFILLQAINIFVSYLHAMNTAWRKMVILSTAAVCIILANFMVVEPIDLYLDRARDFVNAIETKRLQQQARLIFYKERSDGLPIKYLINMPELIEPEFINQPEDLMNVKGPAFIITSLSYFDRLPKEVAANFSVIRKDTLGHVPVIVFTKKGML